jgi:hypothetical protein
MSFLLTQTTEPVHTVNLPSAQVAATRQAPVGLLWIDGDHRCGQGLIAFHDSIDPALGPFRAIREAVNGGAYAALEQVDKIAVPLKQGA